MDTTIRINGKNKARFDNIQRVLSVQKNVSLNQDETLDIILDTEEAALFKDAEGE